MSQTRYQRLRPEDRPICRRCGRPYLAGSTLRVVTYYYPLCRCSAANRKVMRRPVAPPSRVLPAGV